MLKIWITGADGHVGRALAPLLDCTRYRLVETDIDEVDITDQNSVRYYMNLNRPDVVVNCAGFTDVALCEQDSDRAYLVNALGARNLAQEAQNIGAELIQISTDDVFGQGTATPYNEFDPVCPSTVYGKSKYAGEQLVRALMTRYVILRSSWVYGTEHDFVAKVLRAAQKGGTLEVPENEYASPTSAKELAAVILQFIENDSYGTYHAVCRGACSRYEFAAEILALSGQGNRLTLKPVTTPGTVRPVYTVLDNLMLRISGLQEPADWRDALRDYFAEGEVQV